LAVGVIAENRLLPRHKNDLVKSTLQQMKAIIHCCRHRPTVESREKTPEVLFSVLSFWVVVNAVKARVNCYVGELQTRNE